MDLNQGKVLNLEKSFFPSPKDITSRRAAVDNRILEALRQQIVQEINVQYTEDVGNVVMTLTGEGKALTCLILKELRDAGWDAGFSPAARTGDNEMQMWVLTLSPKGKANA